MAMHPLAGKPAPRSMLVNIPRLVAAYYTRKPDAADPEDESSVLRYEKTLSNIQEVKARGGKVLAIATEGMTEVARSADDVLWVPPTRELLLPILEVVPLQLLAYHIAVRRGCDVDQPRNLAKSVTVE